MTWEDWQERWPYVTNFWSRQKKLDFNKNTLMREDYYRCRQWRSQGKSESKNIRNKLMTIAVECGMKFKLTEYYSPDCAVPDRVKITPYGDCTKHHHTMEEADSFKRNEKLMKLAGTEMQKRYKPRDIRNAIRSNNSPAAYAEFEAAGGTFFTLKDVHNAGNEWKSKDSSSTLLGAGLEANRQWLELAEYLEGGKFI